MKKNRLFMITAIFMALTFAFASVNMNAQDKKEEKKVIKMKLLAEDDGTVSIDTTITLEGAFDGDWKDLITDEDLKKKVEEIEIKLQADDDGNVMIMSTGSSGQKYVYVTTTEDEDGEINVEVKKVSEDIMIEEIEGDPGKTYIIKHVFDGDDDGNVMVWHADGDEDIKVFAKKHNVAITKNIDMKVEVMDGDTLMTYTIEVDGDDEGENKVMVWSSDDKNPTDKEVIVHKVKGGKAIIFTSSVEVSDIGESEKNMLAAAGITMGKEILAIEEISITSATPEGNLKVSFPTAGLDDLAVSLLNEKGSVVFMEELKTIKGKYIREIELPDAGKATYFLHISSGKRSTTKKIVLE